MKNFIKNLYENQWFQLGAISIVAFLASANPGIGLLLWFVYFAGWIIKFE